MRIVLAGSGYMATQFVKTILGTKHELCAVIQDGRHTRGIRRRIYPALAGVIAGERTVAGIARRKHVPIVFIDKMDDGELGPLQALKPDLVLVGGFSIILKAPLIRLPRIGCLNCHSSLLPTHRGPNPFRACILANEPETGVTFHIMDEGIDTGSIVEQHRLEIRDTDTAASLSDRCADRACEALPDLHDRIEHEGLHGEPQNETKASYDKKLKDEELYLDWNQPAADLERMVRGCFPYSLARFRYQGRTVIVSRAQFEPGHPDAKPGEIVATRPHLKIATGDGVFVLIVGYTMRPIPWIWPRILSRPAVGERVE